MSWYILNIDGEAPNQNGVECDTLAKAQCQAVEFAGDILRNEASAFWRTKDWGMTVTDEDGLALFSLTLFATECAAADDLQPPIRRSS